MSQGDNVESTRPAEDPSSTIKTEGNQESNADKAPNSGVPDARVDAVNGGDAAVVPSTQQQTSPPELGSDDTANGRPNGHRAEETKVETNGNSVDEVAVGEEDGGAEALDSSQGSNEGDAEYSSDNYEADLRRVKVYELIGSRWTDRGTAFCSGDFDEPTQQAKLIARSETDPNAILLSCAIRANDVYQRQQDTLIVWTEPDGTDFALSFQDVEGCTEVWEFIVEVQRHLGARGTLDFDNLDAGEVLDSETDELFSSSPRFGSRQPSFTTQEIIRSGRLPQPEASIIGEIEKAIRALGRTPKTRENLSAYIQENNYIHSLVDIFRVAEQAEDLDTLHSLCSCMQTILVLNEHQMYEHILSDDIWMNVVGILEYDPEFPKHKANYRDFLLQRTRFAQPIAIDDLSIQRKIHHTYRLQYLKDVILGRALDDATFNVLNSCIIFNQVDIINHIQHDERFLNELVSLFVPQDKAKAKEEDKESQMDVDKPVVNGSATANGTSSEAPHSPEPGPAPKPTDDIDTRRNEVILLLQQLCQIGKNVQLPARIALFRTLVERGVLYALQWALCRSERSDRPLVSTAGEILTTLLDHQTAAVRSHILTQAIALGQPTGSKEEEEGEKGKAKAIGPEKPKESTEAPPFPETLLQLLCRMLPNSEDLAVQCQLAESLRMLLDIPQGDGNGETHMGAATKLLSRQTKDDPSVERFLDNFYKVCVDTLFRPILSDVPEHQETENSPPLNPSREKGNLYLYLCDLLCSFATQHSFRSFFFILSSKISARIASLLNVRDKHLCLAALRFFRICLKMNNSNLFRHLDKVGIYTPIVKLTLRESKRNNLLSSTCQEFFDTIRKESLKEPMLHIFKQHAAEIRQLGENNQYGGAGVFCTLNLRYEIIQEGPPKEEEKKPTPSNIPAGQRIFDTEEDDYFNSNDDDEEDSIVPVPRVGNFINLPRRKRLRVSVPGQPQMNRPRLVPSQLRPQSPLSSLLDYDDDDDITSPSLLQASSSLNQLGDGPVRHRQIEILPYDPSSEDKPSSDPEDDILEALVTKSKGDGAASAKASSKSPPPSKQSMDLPSRLREKRRRSEEDEEDEMLERLATKNRRLGNSASDESKSRPSPVAGKPSEDGAKKLKLKFSMTRTSDQLTQTPPSSKPDSKDAEKG
ncbi:DUF625-domain-containing protein [Schizopora paradoxa]|uniref:DUF625-domain-containing protein n=1 Tax=Schizopora paradoxa TaxID=27342 RepID=A0A0H2S6P0_9AGAM|nr:DUF625-domain-containing protein [Schizopora paradoxa]